MEDGDSLAPVQCRKAACLPSPGESFMSWRRVPFVKGAVLALAGFLLLGSSLLAGPGVPGRIYNNSSPQPAPAAVARAAPSAVALHIVVGVHPPAAGPLPRAPGGPDGQVRRFPVEGGREAIQVQSVTVRAGESVTIRWTPAK